MSRYSPTGKSKWYWLTTVADTQAVTVAEAGAGVDLTPDSQSVPGIPRTGNLIDTADMANKFESRDVGTRGGDVATLTIFRDDTTETAYDTLTEDARGYLMYFRKGLAGATPAAGDEYDIFPAAVLTVEDGNPGRNDADTAQIGIVVTAPPDRKQTMVA